MSGLFSLSVTYGAQSHDLSMNSASPPSRVTVIAILSVGILSVSTAAIFIRLALESSNQQGLGFSLVIAALRLSIASALLMPTWRSLQPAQPRSLLLAAAAGIFLAAHFASWITSLSYTSIAASTTLVTTNPVWVALLSWLIWRERPTGVTTIGIIVAIAGSLIVGLSDVAVSATGQQPLLGNGLALVGSWTVSGYFLLSREAQKHGLTTQQLIIIAYSMAAVVLLPLPMLAQTSYWGYPPRVYGYIALMAVFPQLIGHTSLNWAVRWISPTLVTLVILAEPLGSGILSFMVFNENPGWVVIGGGAVLLTGVAIAALGSRPSVQS
jgi:drug/metabolite transporter (DMT)-like permease